MQRKHEILMVCTCNVYAPSNRVNARILNSLSSRKNKQPIFISLRKAVEKGEGRRDKDHCHVRSTPAPSQSLDHVGSPPDTRSSKSEMMMARKHQYWQTTANRSGNVVLRVPDAKISKRNTSGSKLIKLYTLRNMLAECKDRAVRSNLTECADSYHHSINGKNQRDENNEDIQGNLTSTKQIYNTSKLEVKWLFALIFQFTD
ncbi:hypothetical protein IW262DRAFT_1302658 [Armillaria fumosa]|nr:hypothetical protein IW262DRAFT_1302658 [Armillaria fumosa]